jgi:hypothetical protein
VERSAFWPQGQVPRYRLDRAEQLGDYLYLTYKPRAGSHDGAADTSPGG